MRRWESDKWQYRGSGLSLSRDRQTEKQRGKKIKTAGQRLTDGGRWKNREDSSEIQGCEIEDTERKHEWTYAEGHGGKKRKRQYFNFLHSPTVFPGPN